MSATLLKGDSDMEQMNKKSDNVITPELQAKIDSAKEE